MLSYGSFDAACLAARVIAPAAVLVVVEVEGSPGDIKSILFGLLADGLAISFAP